MKYIGRNLASKLNHQIKFFENQSNSEIENDNWLEITSAYAEIKPLSDTSFKMVENFNFGHVMTENYYLFCIRFNKRISNKMRIYFENRKFEIKRILNLREKDLVMQIIALEI